MPRCPPSSGHQYSTVLPTSAPPRSPGGAASTVHPAGGIGGGAPAAPANGGCDGARRGGLAAGRLLKGGAGGFAFGQVVKRPPPVARRVEACPAHQHVTAVSAS